MWSNEEILLKKFAHLIQSLKIILRKYKESWTDLLQYIWRSKGRRDDK